MALGILSTIDTILTVMEDHKEVTHAHTHPQTAAHRTEQNRMNFTVTFQ